MTVRAVMFDLGHTLWDIGPQRGQLEAAYAAARAKLSARLGRDDLPPAAAFQHAVRDVLYENSATYFTDSGALDQPPSHTWVDAGLRRLGLELDERLLKEITPALFATEIDCLICDTGTLDAVQWLADAGYALGCITNTLADTPAIRAMLRLHGLEALMQCVVVSSDEGWRKPHPSLFLKAAGELGVPPHHAVFVGDSPWHDVAGAKGVGMRAVLTRQYVTRPLPADAPPPDAVIQHLRELPDTLAALGRVGQEAR